MDRKVFEGLGMGFDELRICAGADGTEDVVVNEVVGGHAVRRSIFELRVPSGFLAVYISLAWRSVAINSWYT